MRSLALTFAVLVLVAGTVGAANPRIILGATDFLKSRAGLWVAAAVRVVAGTLWLLVAAGSRLPRVMYVLGAIALLSGIALPVLGLDRLRALVEWWERQPPAVVRASCGVAALAGALLTYALV